VADPKVYFLAVVFVGLDEAVGFEEMRGFMSVGGN
jgi:hypothetical protein